MRIAVLDDDPGQTNLVCQALTSIGHTYHPFQSGTEILNQLRRKSYDMPVLDRQVPDLNGLEVFR